MTNLTQEEIMLDWGIDNSDNPLVSVKCMTYNHEKYISQALDGFLMQKTTFPFEVLVHDDASTDKTVDILREYEKRFPKIVKVIYEKENQYKFNKHHEKINKLIKGKYLAVCEGDDYWTYPNKLQMQVKYLENHPEFVMCHTAARKYIEKDKKLSRKKIGAIKQNYKQIFVNGNAIVTLTSIYRTSVYKEYLNQIPEAVRKTWDMGDLPLWLYFTKKYKVKHFNRVCGVYRVLDNSASHSNNEEKKRSFRISSLKVRQFFDEKFNERLIDYYNIVEMIQDAVLVNDKRTIFKLWKLLPFYAKTKKINFYFVKSLITIFR